MQPRLSPVGAMPQPMNVTNTDCHENSIHLLVCHEEVIIIHKEQTKLQGFNPVKCAAELQIQNGWRGARSCNPHQSTWKQHHLAPECKCSNSNYFFISQLFMHLHILICAFSFCKCTFINRHTNTHTHTNTHSLSLSHSCTNTHTCSQAHIHISD